MPCTAIAGTGHGPSRGRRAPRGEGREAAVKMDVFPHILPRKYFDRLLAVAPPGPALQKRMSGFPMLVDLDLRFTMMDRWDGYVQSAHARQQKLHAGLEVLRPSFCAE